MVWPTIYYPLHGRENYYPSKTPFFHFFKLPFLSLSIHKFVRTFGRVNFILQLSGQNPTLREIRTQDRNLEAETTSGHEEGVLTELIRNLLWVCMCIDLVDLKGLIFLMSFISCSYILSALSSTAFPEPWMKGFDGDIPFKAESSMVSDSLHNVWLWVSVLVSICCRR